MTDEYNRDSMAELIRISEDLGLYDWSTEPDDSDPLEHLKVPGPDYFLCEDLRCRLTLSSNYSKGPHYHHTSDQRSWTLEKETDE